MAEPNPTGGSASGPAGNPSGANGRSGRTPAAEGLAAQGIAAPTPAAPTPAVPTPPALPPLIVGCWSWGDERTWGYRSRFGDDDLRAAVRALDAAGLRWFDTAEVYGRGRSERLLGDLTADLPGAAVSTKFFPYPWRLTGSGFRRGLASALRRLRRDRVELYQAHHEVPAPLARRWAGHLAAARRDGLVGAIGTSNLSAPALRAFSDALAEHGERVTAHQTRYNLCDRRVERHGVVELCRERGITLLAHSALAQGLLSGRYRAGAPMTGRRPIPDPVLAQTAPLLALLDRVADRLDATPAAVALAWLRHRGATPVVGVHDRAQAEDAAVAARLVLPGSAAAALDKVSAPWRGRP